LQQGAAETDRGVNAPCPDGINAVLPVTHSAGIVGEAANNGKK